MLILHMLLPLAQSRYSLLWRFQFSTISVKRGRQTKAYNKQIYQLQEFARNIVIFALVFCRVRQMFPSKQFTRRSDINCPPRSPNLIPLYFFLWGHLKCKVYTNKPTFLADLKENIRRELAIIITFTYRVVIRNYTVRLNALPVPMYT